MAEDMNYGEWFEGRKSFSLQLAHNATKEVMHFSFGNHGSSGWFLIDTSAIDASKITGEVTLSFKVSNYTGQANTVTFSAWDGKGLEFSGNRESGGHVRVKSFSDFPTLNLKRQPPALINTANADDPLGSSKIAANGLSSLRFNMSEAGTAGDFVLIGWAASAQPKFKFDLDDFKLEVSGASKSSRTVAKLPVAVVRPPSVVL